jgi:hypothetical protein
VPAIVSRARAARAVLIISISKRADSVQLMPIVTRRNDPEYGTHHARVLTTSYHQARRLGSRAAFASPERMRSCRLQIHPFSFS